MNSDGRNRKAIVAGLGLSYAYSALQVIVYLLYVPLLLRTIGQSEYGLYQLVGSAGAYIVALNTVLSAGLTKYYSMYYIRGDFRRMRSTLAIGRRFVLFLGLGSLGLFGLLVAGVRSIYDGRLAPYELDQATVMLLILAVDTLVVMYTTSNVAVVTAHERFVFLKGMQLGILVCQPLAVLGAVQIWPSAVAVTSCFLAMNVISAVVQQWYVAKVLRESARFEGYDREIVRNLFKFFPGVLLVVVADQIFWRADQLILGYMLDLSAVAVYSIGSQIYKVYMPVGTTVSGIFLPRVSRLFEEPDGIERVSALFARVGRLSIALLFLVLSAFSVFGMQFVRMWAGPEYGTAFWVALVVMIPFTVDLVQNLGITILQVADKYLVRGVMYLVVAIVNIGVTVPMVHYFGIVGAAISTGLCMFAGSGVFMNWYYHRRMGLDMRLFWSEVGKLVGPLAGFALVFGALWHLSVDSSVGVVTLVIGGCAYCAGYFVWGWLFSFREGEKDLMRRAARRVQVFRRQ